MRTVQMQSKEIPKASEQIFDRSVSCNGPFNPMMCYTLDQSAMGAATGLREFDVSLTAPRIAGRILVGLPPRTPSIHPRDGLHLRQVPDSKEQGKSPGTDRPADILNDIPDLILRCSAEGQILYSNGAFRAFCEGMTDNTSQIAVQRFTAGHSRETFKAAIAGLTRDAPHTVLQQTVFPPQSAARVIEWSITKRFEGSAFIELLCVGRDVSTYAVEKKELLSRAIRSETESDAKSAFVADIGHELKNPLNGIMGMAHLLQCSVHAGRETGYIKNILAAGDELQTLLKDIVDLGVMDADAMEVARKPFHMSDIFEKVGSLYGTAAIDAHKPFQFHLERSCRRLLVGCHGRIKQVLTNLLINAIKYASAGTIQITASIEFPTRGEPTLYVCVDDQGPGIADEDKSRIFKRFARLDGGATMPEGHGLGLSISKQICQMHGGTLIVEDSNRGGSRFRASFRVSPSQDNVLPPATPLAKLQGAALGLNILVVEDNELNATFMKQILGQSGASVSVAENGAVGLDRILKEDFDIVFTDIRMPVMDGIEMLEAFEKCRAKGHKTPQFIACSGGAETEDGPSLRSIGFNAAIEKPVSIANISRFLSDFVAGDSADITSGSL